MKIVLLAFIIVSTCFAQSEYTIVAVGSAEKEKQKIAFLKTKMDSNLTSQNSRFATELIGLIKSDFAFYRHLFESVESDLSSEEVNYKNLKTKNYALAVGMKFFMNATKLNAQIKFYNVLSKTEAYVFEGMIDTNNLRTFGHKISDKAYEAITGKKSIFNTKIVFVSDRTSRGKEIKKEVYIMDFDGKRVQRLTFHDGIVIAPALSPDNSQLAYTIAERKWRKTPQGIRKIQNLNLYQMDLKTKKAKILSDQIGINSGAAFSADGKKIYLTLSYHKNADIYEMDLTTRATRRITAHRSDDVDPAINANGSLMTFLSGRSGRAMIYTCDPRGQERQMKRISFVGRFNATPRFSPDGKEIVFSSWVDNRFDIYRIGFDGKNLVRLTKNFGSNEEPSFSPDGQFIVFTSQRVLSRDKALQDVYIMNREGEILGRVTHDFGSCFTPRWSN